MGGQYIKSNVLKGVFYNLNKLLHGDSKRFDRMLSDYIDKYKNIPKALENFSEDVASELFGVSSKDKNRLSKESITALENQLKVIKKEYKELSEEIQSGRQWDHELRDIIKKISGIVKHKLDYDPKTGNNNMAELSYIFINEINDWLNHIYTSKMFKYLKDGRIEFKRTISQIVRRVLLMIIMAMIQTLGFRRVEFGKSVEKKLKKIYNISNSKEQFELIKQFEAEGLPVYGSVLYRGQTYTKRSRSSGHIIWQGKTNLAQFYGNLKSGVMGKGTAWTPNLEVAGRYANKCVNARRFGVNPISFREFKRLVDSDKIYDIGAIYVDKKGDIERIVKYILDKNIEVNNVNVIFSQPILNTVSKQKFKEPIQMITHVSAIHDEIIFIPNQIRFDDTTIDAYISFQSRAFLEAWKERMGEA